MSRVSPGEKCAPRFRIFWVIASERLILEDVKVPMGKCRGHPFAICAYISAFDAMGVSLRAQEPKAPSIAKLFIGLAPGARNENGYFFLIMGRDPVSHAKHATQ